MAFTGEKKRAWQREYLKKYVQENPDRIKKYHRTAALERARKQGYLPAKRTIAKYEIQSRLPNWSGSHPVLYRAREQTRSDTDCMRAHSSHQSTGDFLLQRGKQDAPEAR